MNRTTYIQRVNDHLKALGLSTSLFDHRHLPIFEEPESLIYVETAPEGREIALIPEACEAWLALKEAARKQGHDMALIHGFRDLQSQSDIIHWRLQTGHTLESALLGSAPPGYSEHHTGRAIDIITPRCPPFDERFEKTPAYHWLQRHAAEYGFFLSFPPGNCWGYVYEPWHWFFRPGYDYPYCPDPSTSLTDDTIRPLVSLDDRDSSDDGVGMGDLGDMSDIGDMGDMGDIGDIGDIGDMDRCQ